MNEPIISPWILYFDKAMDITGDIAKDVINALRESKK